MPPSRRRKRKVAIACAALVAGMATTLLTATEPRRYAVRPLNRNRRQKYSHYFTLVKFMRDQDEEQFFKYTRMTPSMFDHLLTLVKSDLQKAPERRPISPEERLMMTLHYLAEGCSMQQIAWDYYVGKSTVHYIIKETCSVLWRRLQPLMLPEPSGDQWQYIAQSFFERWNIPNCVGALDGKHVNIQAPKHSGSDYFNYKKNFSLVLMATCDAYYKFTMVDVGAAGSNHDSGILQQSSMGKKCWKSN